MIDRDPFEDWLMRTQIGAKPHAREQQELKHDLQRLEDWLDKPPTTKHRDIPNVRGGLWIGSVTLAPRDIPRVQQIYRRLVHTTGAGKSYVETELLSLLAYALDPASIAFFVELLDLAPPRDKMAARRRELALAALALMAYRTDDAAALAALVEATSHKHPSVRAFAVHYLSYIFLGADEIDFSIPLPAGPLDMPEFGDLEWLLEIDDPDEADAEIDDDEENAEEEAQPEADEPIELRRPLPPALIERLTRMASGDPAFEPRFMARALLRDAGEVPPLDHPDSLYAFKVKLRGLPGMYRTIAARATDTLHDLHLAIQASIDWDNDHLYSFFLNNKRYDERYSFASPWDSDSPATADDVQIGGLGLMPKHKFMYYFDYGDSHEFEVEVVAVEPQTAPGEYPRVVESHGAAPRQYHYADDDEEWDDEDELEDEV